MFAFAHVGPVNVDPFIALHIALFALFPAYVTCPALCVTYPVVVPSTRHSPNTDYERVNLVDYVTRCVVNCNVVW